MKLKTILLLLFFALSLGCLQAQPASTPQIKKGTIKITILYPNAEGKTFNMDYYSKNHMPMAAKLFGSSLKLMAIDKGVASGTPNTPIPFLAIGYFYFDTLAAFQKAFGPNAEKIRSDIPNYTNITPIVQISEVLE